MCLAVLGCGYTGLSTAALFADAGFHVIAVDINSKIVEKVNMGFPPINEPNLHELLSRNVQLGRLRATLNSLEALSQSNAVIISVQTPINQKKKPNLSFLTKALGDVGKTLRKGMLVVISSTLPPKTMLENVKPKLESLSNLKVDDDFYLVYAPERMAPGRAIKEFVESPKIVGGVGPNSTKVAAQLFKTVCKKVIETDATTAEIAKLAENTFRDLNIAFANQLALICEQLGVDVIKVIKLANTHPRVNIHLPGPGVGGPCLPKDPYLLVHQLKPETYSLVKKARQINDFMPKYIVKLTIRALKLASKDIKNSKIAILGTAYKANVDDGRFSPSKSIISELRRFTTKMLVFDPYCKESFGVKKADSLSNAVKDADCILIVTDHKEFKNLNLKKIKKLMKKNPAIVDGRRIINPYKATKLGFIYFGVGLGELK
ncbi:nucleotide sugar dehydrogenase [Candidatus Bathyarchaeota archaeon]|nr:MAG: nucleotide sugar dehydrogenase [Candidatus Bathyarchaeota archaeon]